MLKHHKLDVKPIPENVLYINEKPIADPTVLDVCETMDETGKPDKVDDNIRIYVPLDLNRNALLRRLKDLERQNGTPTEENEMRYQSGIERVIAQLEIYDQVWYVREANFSGDPELKHHSQHAKETVSEMIKILDEWSETSTVEHFPYHEIAELKEEYET